MLSPILGASSLGQVGQDVASHPFDDPSADIVLHTSDDTVFRVHRIILSLSSPFFKEMFTLPQSPPSATASSSSNDSIIPIEENSQVLDCILRHLYPSCEPPQWNELGEIVPVVQAMIKYQMEETQAFQNIMNSLLARANTDKRLPLVPTTAIGVLAIIYRFRDSMKKEWIEEAARAFLRLPFKMFNEQWDCPEFDYITGRGYRKLLVYHKQCSERIRTWSPRWSDSTHMAYDCVRGTDSTTWHASVGLSGLRKTFDYVRDEYKDNPYIVADWPSFPFMPRHLSSCDICKDDKCPYLIWRAHKLLKAEVDAAIAEVPLPF
ncbi:hypothetical protein Moror_2453 [Moniliophthora roreri MCA 2997]|uniref:BTB domain-containing protein n=1 Tax=Moniliophthora roreri (strain MCA 2997) TaxID=1381753 RepID=V2Y282_MONRO|nr:hypothetical protein Moror_2453 [Moniliophthora roreri MCA 2997]